MRVAFVPKNGTGETELRAAIMPVAKRLAMQWQFAPRHRPVRTLILVSKFGHCLNDLVFRYKINALPIDVQGVVSNHTTFQRFCSANGVPFSHIPVTPETKLGSESQLIEMIEDKDIELIILARYMQVLSDELCSRYPGRIINIHHSLLPSFKGAKPYHRAHERGVKLIGATAHYVTTDLDEGPIIEQGVAAVRHNMTANDLIAKGREVETNVLSSAVQACGATRFPERPADSRLLAGRQHATTSGFPGFKTGERGVGRRRVGEATTPSRSKGPSMPIYELGGRRPTLPPDGASWIAPSAEIIGDAQLGRDVSVWFGAVVRADNTPIFIGERTNVQDGAMLHSDPGAPLRIGADCTVGHHAILHGCTLGDLVLVGMGATIMNGASIGNDCIIGAGALIPAGKAFPPQSLLMGVPAKVVRPLDERSIASTRNSAALYVARWQAFAVELRRID